MISEFTSLIEKLKQLAELAQALRGENTALRSELAALAAENSALDERIKQASTRVEALLASLPTESQDQETA
jgi:uncharacterized protein (TIGR02449 family)